MFIFISFIYIWVCIFSDELQVVNIFLKHVVTKWTEVIFIIVDFDAIQVIMESDSLYEVLLNTSSQFMYSYTDQNPVLDKDEALSQLSTTTARINEDKPTTEDYDFFR